MKTQKVRYKILAVLMFLTAMVLVCLKQTEGGIFSMCGAIYCRVASWEEEKPGR